MIAVTHIQNIEPGPANEIARATPAMFPNPIVPDKDVVSAWKGLTSPSSLFFSLDKRMLKAVSYTHLTLPTRS